MSRSGDELRKARGELRDPRNNVVYKPVSRHLDCYGAWQVDVQWLALVHGAQTLIWLFGQLAANSNILERARS
jgi:hypothetical protein